MASKKPNNEERKEDKILRQRTFVDAVITDLQKGKQFQGVLPILKKLGIAIGTYSRWLSDPDFSKAKDEIQQMRRVVLNDEYWRAMLTGEGIHKAAYVVAGLKGIDPEWSDRVSHSGQLTNVHIVSAVRADASAEDRQRILASDN